MLVGRLPAETRPAFANAARQLRGPSTGRAITAAPAALMPAQACDPNADGYAAFCGITVSIEGDPGEAGAPRWPASRGSGQLPWRMLILRLLIVGRSVAAG